MFHKTIFGALAAAAAGALIAVKVLKDREKKSDDSEENEDDEEVHFIRIEDGDAPEEEKKQEEPAEKESGPEVQEVAAVYPYLDSAFVEKTLGRNDELNQEYADDTLVTVSHHVKFDDEEGLKAFDEILTNGGYEVKTDGSEASASRKFYTQPGAVISDILNVANQTAALKGSYEGYDITK